LKSCFKAQIEETTSDGYDAQTGEYADLVKKGIIDPT
jgi:chaperonin GroEL (HSP60 family)